MNNIKKYRGQNQIHQKDLADMLNISRARLCYFESEKCKNVPLRILLLLEKKMNVSKIKLLGVSNLRYLPENDEDLNFLIESIKEWYEFKKRR